MTESTWTQRVGNARNAVLRSSLTLLVQNHEAEDIVQILGEVVDDHSFQIAQRTGDTSRAATLAVIAKHLNHLDDYVENFDPTPE